MATGNLWKWTRLWVTLSLLGALQVVLRKSQQSRGPGFGTKAGMGEAPPAQQVLLVLVSGLLQPAVYLEM